MYKDDLHVYKIVHAAWSTFKPTYTQAHFIYIIFFIDIAPLDKSALNIYTNFQTHLVYYLL